MVLLFHRQVGCGCSYEYDWEELGGAGTPFSSSSIFHLYQTEKTFQKHYHLLWNPNMKLTGLRHLEASVLAFNSNLSEYKVSRAAEAKAPGAEIMGSVADELMGSGTGT